MHEADRHPTGFRTPGRAGSTPRPRPRVLFLSCHLPWPPASGGRRREFELIRRLAPRFDVHLVVVSKTPDEDAKNVGALTPFCRRVEVFAAERPKPEGGTSADLSQVARHRSRTANKRVREILATDRVDLLHVEGFYLMQHVPGWVEAPVLLVEQNIEYELERQRARCVGGAVIRLDSFARFVRTHDAELDCWRRATRLATVTWEDRELMRRELPAASVSVVPDGADHVPSRNRGAPALERPHAPLAVLLANFGYAPNVDAALFFAREILPAVREDEDLHVWLVGNAPPPEVRALAGDRVTVTGYVPDVLGYLDAADAVVCPLRIGGGIKVKTIEALRRGKAIVSTGIGAQGLSARARSALLIADEPREFARALTTLILDPSRRALLERRARAAAATLPTWDQSARALSAVYDELLQRVEAKAQPLPPPRLEPIPILAGRSS